MNCPNCNTEHEGQNKLARDLLRTLGMSGELCQPCAMELFSARYEKKMADCLNGSDCEWEHTHTFPLAFTMMRCSGCGKERKPTDEEWIIIKRER